MEQQPYILSLVQRQTDMRQGNTERQTRSGIMCAGLLANSFDYHGPEGEREVPT